MPDEALISEIENLLSQVIELGGQNERSQVVPNLTVQNANPTGLTDFVIVSDDRDGDNILAQKVGSIVYSNNDKVNVLFVKGGEAIAFQQGSQSSNSGIWEIVPSTSTDIFYDKGDVGIGTTSPGVPLDVYGPASHQARFIANANNTSAGIIINRRGTGDGAILFTETGVADQWSIGHDQSNSDAFQFARGSAIGTNVRLTIEAGGNVGIGTTAIPHGGIGVAKLAIEGEDASAAGPHIQLTTAADDYPLLQVLAFQHDNIPGPNYDSYFDGSNWRSGDAGSNFQIEKRANLLRFNYDSGVAQGSILTWNDGIVLDIGGNVGIGTTTPSTRLDIDAGAMEFAEMTAPAAGAVNTARLFAQDNGAGKTQLAVRFNTGAIQILATEP